MKTDDRFVQVLAALLRETVRIDFRAGRGGADFRRRSSERAEALLARVPALAHLAAPVARAITDDAAAAWARVGIAGAASEHPDVPPPPTALPLATTVPAADEPDVLALRQDYDRRATALDAALDALAAAPANDAAAFLAALKAPLEHALGEVPLGDNAITRTISLFDLAWLSAAVTAAGTKCLLVTARLDGTQNLLHDEGPARGARLVEVGNEMHQRLLTCMGALDVAVLRRPSRRSLVLVADGDDQRRALGMARASIERDLLAEFAGAIVPVIAWHACDPEAFADGDALQRSLETADGNRAKTPFLDALATAGAFGPFPPMSVTLDPKPAPLAVACVTLDARPNRLAEGPLPFLALLAAARAGDRLQDEIAHEILSGEPQLARNVELLPWRGEMLLARGALIVLPRFLHRLATRCRRLAGADGFEIAAGLVLCAPSSDGTVAPSAQVRGWRRAQDALVRALSSEKRGRTAALGAVVSTRSLERHAAMGEALAGLARDERGAIAALAMASEAVANGGLPVSAVQRLKARIHEIAAMLGVDGHEPHGGTGSADDAGPDAAGGLSALRALVREFPRMFEAAKPASRSTMR